MKRKNYWVLALVTGGCVVGLSLPGFAQSWLGLGNSQEEEKIKAQRQAPVERAFSENYYQLDEKERALAGEKYDMFLKQRADSIKSGEAAKDKANLEIKPLNAPSDPFQSPDFKAFQGSKK